MAKKKAAAPVLEPGKKKPGRKLIPEDPTLDTAERAAIKAVRDFEVAEKVINMFKIDHSDVLKTYDELLEEREQKRQVADAAMRACNASFGPWDRYSEQKRYNPETLYGLIGEQKFLELGGEISKVNVYTMSGEQIELAIAANKIPKEVIPEVKKVSSVYHAPK